MEVIKGFFTKDNLIALFDQFYRWLEGVLINIFGNYTYEPLRALFVNPFFWLIIVVLILLGLIFRRR